MKAQDAIDALVEMAAPTDAMRGQTYYHGTTSAQGGEDILVHGIKPPEITLGGTRRPRGHLTPVQGQVYLTTHLPYALIYAVGGCYLNSTYAEQWRGQPGYLFVVPGSELSDVQPDEDDVGYVYSLLFKPPLLSPGKYPFVADHHQRLISAIHGDANMASDLRQHLERTLTDTQKKTIRQGLMNGQASGGKRALKTMPDYMKLWLLKHGCHVANGGVVQPSQAWKFDRGDARHMTPDGSNFFQIAKRVA